MKFLLIILFPLISVSQIELDNDAFESQLPFTKELKGRIRSTTTKIYKLKKRDSTLLSKGEFFFNIFPNGYEQVDSLTSSDPLDTSIIYSQKLFWQPINLLDSVLTFQNKKVVHRQLYYYKDISVEIDEDGIRYIKTREFDIPDSIISIDSIVKRRITYERGNDYDLFKYVYNTVTNDTDTFLYDYHLGPTLQKRFSENEITKFGENFKVVKNKNGDEKNITEFKYDKKGNIFEAIFKVKDKVIIKTTYEFEFDDMGNWTKVVTKSKNKRMGTRNKTVTIRTIKYAE